MTNGDLFRAVLISLAVVLVGVLFAGAFVAYRDRNLPVPRRAPIPAVILFVIGYLLLLLQLIVERWVNLGKAIGPGAWVALVALVFNLIALIVLVRSSWHPASESEH